MSDNRASVYIEDDRTIYRASGFGGCIKSLAMAKAGIEGTSAPEAVQRAWDIGSRMESRLLEDLKAEVGGVYLDGEVLRGYGEVQDNGQVECELVFGKRVIRVHPDGIIQIVSRKGGDGRFELNQRYVCEVKYLGDAYYEKVKGDIKDMPFYAWQLSIEMLATGLPALYGVGLKCSKCKGTGHKVVEDENGADKEWPLKCETCKGKAYEWKGVKIYEEPPYSKVEVIKRLMELEGAAADYEAGEEVNCDWKMYPCPFFSSHSGGIWAEEEGNLGDSREVLVELVSEYRDLDARTREPVARMTRIKEEIKELFAKLGMKKYSGSGVVYYESTNKGRVDTKKMEEDGIDVEKYRGGDKLVKTVRFGESDDS